MLHTIIIDCFRANLQLQQRRLGHRLRGKAPILCRTIKDRLEELNYKDELYTAKVDIGFPADRRTSVKQEQLEHLKRIKNDKQMEKLARNYQLEIDLQEAKKVWLETLGPYHKKQIADHYSIYEHLYGEGYFVPFINIEVTYDLKNGTCLPVYTGNVIKPSEALEQPEVLFKSDGSSLWTLVLSSLDGHMQDSSKEYAHWIVANIPGNAIEKGDTIVEYIQPLPLKGTGYHRYVFVLYKQNDRILFDIPEVTSPAQLEARTFVTRDWYKKYQDIVTPAGLAFYQTIWDSSVKDFFHDILKQKEPIYEYDFPEPYIRPQEWFPLRKPFNLYMDKYRDPKQVKKEYLVRKLKNEDPFKSPDPPLRFPNAHPLPHSMPSWLKLHEKKIRLGWGRVNDV
ncbi:39S ribosomal protein L38, mitochondrial [Leptidea sinapis]|uniref:39S ribosomal protein L38, mitochondrial n=1 Tax=Leptidea sinapis TaxID=189913 RepID=UPI00212AE150|nr:39S ribosomal protein L38, mitochondrial [Leptidea sinapis]